MAAKINKIDKKSGLRGLVASLVERIQISLYKKAPPMLQNRYPKAAEIEPFGQSSFYPSDTPEMIRCEINSIEDSILPFSPAMDEASDEQLDKFINPETWTDDLQKADCDK